MRYYVSSCTEYGLRLVNLPATTNFPMSLWNIQSRLDYNEEGVGQSTQNFTFQWMLEEKPLELSSGGGCDLESCCLRLNPGGDWIVEGIRAAYDAIHQYFSPTITENWKVWKLQGKIRSRYEISKRLQIDCANQLKRECTIHLCFHVQLSILSCLILILPVTFFITWEIAGCICWKLWNYV